MIVVKDLTFEKKGEESYAAIMCSNMLSKYAYLQYSANMEKSLKMELPRGNSNTIDHIAVDLANTYGQNILTKVTKTNMSNFKRVMETLKK